MKKENIQGSAASPPGISAARTSDGGTSAHGDDMSRLRQRMSAGELNEARQLAHMLKGSSGNLGAIGVQGLAAKLEMVFKDGHNLADIGRLANKLETGLQKLVTGIRAALPVGLVAPCVGEVDWALGQPELAQ